MFGLRPVWFDLKVWEACKALNAKLKKGKLGKGSYNRKRSAWVFYVIGAEFEVLQDGGFRVIKSGVTLPELNTRTLEGAETALSIVLRHATQLRNDIDNTIVTHAEKCASFAAIYTNII